MMRRLAFWILLSLGMVLLCTALLLVYLSRKDYEAEFISRKGHLDSAEVDTAGQRVEGDRFWLRLHGSTGLTAECGLLAPPGRGMRYPAIVLLGGKATGKYAVDYALGVRNVIIVAPDYPYAPRESYSVIDVLTDVPKVRQALFDMIPSVGLAMDYLWTREDVDTGRVVLLGYSFGAPYVPYLASHDRRFAVAAMVYGGGDLESLIRYNVRRYEGPLFSDCVGFLSGMLLRPLEPLGYIKDVSPTPLVMINGEQDEQVPPQYARLLFAAAREPKRIIWLPSRHVNPRDTALTRTIIHTLSRELGQMGVLPPTSRDE